MIKLGGLILRIYLIISTITELRISGWDIAGLLTLLRLQDFVMVLPQQNPESIL